jgi:hypothetical protein
LLLFIECIEQRRFGHGEHHLSRLEVDIMHRTTADFLPKPKGSFQELQAKRNAVYNRTLLLGVAIFISALVGVS